MLSFIALLLTVHAAVPEVTGEYPLDLIELRRMDGGFFEGQCDGNGVLRLPVRAVCKAFGRAKKAAAELKKLLDRAKRSRRGKALKKKIEKYKKTCEEEKKFCRKFTKLVDRLKKKLGDESDEGDDRRRSDSDKGSKRRLTNMRKWMKNMRQFENIVEKHMMFMVFGCEKQEWRQLHGAIGKDLCGQAYKLVSMYEKVGDCKKSKKPDSEECEKMDNRIDNWKEHDSMKEWVEDWSKYWQKHRRYL